MSDSLSLEFPRSTDSPTRALLLIDDDVKYCRLVSKYLSKHGYEVTLVHNGSAAVETALSRTWDAIVLDIMLPGLGGYEILRAVRERSAVPILMLTALSDETDRIVGLELGADDYLPKSYSPRELLARLRAVTRRFDRSVSIGDGKDQLVVGPLVISPSARKVTLSGVAVKLTAIEFDLLVLLAQAAGRIKTREQLLNGIREVADYDTFDRSIDVHVSALRRKLGDDAKNPRLIKTIRSVGYTLVNPNEPEH